MIFDEKDMIHVEEVRPSLKQENEVINAPSVGLQGPFAVIGRAGTAVRWRGRERLSRGGAAAIFLKLLLVAWACSKQGGLSIADGNRSARDICCHPSAGCRIQPSRR